MREKDKGMEYRFYSLFYCVAPLVFKRENRLGADYTVEDFSTLKIQPLRKVSFSLHHWSRHTLSMLQLLAVLLGFYSVPLSQLVTHTAVQLEASHSHHLSAYYSGQSNCCWHVKMLHRVLHTSFMKY